MAQTALGHIVLGHILPGTAGLVWMGGLGGMLPIVDSDTNNTNKQAVAEPVAVERLTVGEVFSPITLLSTDGKLRSVDEFRGTKTILIHFASW